MRQITSLTSDPKQQFDAVIEGYDAATIYLEYKPQQYGWFMNITWGNFASYNIRVALGPNILRQFKNILPFGIAIGGINNIEPVLLTDWLSNNQFYILDAAEVQLVEDAING